MKKYLYFVIFFAKAKLRLAERLLFCILRAIMKL